MASPTLHIEFFFRAGQFRRAYEQLLPDREPPDWPKYLLAFHAVELALKAYLIQCGVSEEDLKDEFPSLDAPIYLNRARRRIARSL
jgi:hypothetical protein